MKIIFPRLVVCCILAFLWQTSTAQSLDSLAQAGLAVELQAGLTDKDAAPFWMRSNQYGNTTPEGFSGSLILQAFRHYQTQGAGPTTQEISPKKWDWGFGFEADLQLAKKNQIQLIDAHFKLRFAMLALKVGRSKDVMGLNGDSLLTSGNFALSGNALGIPKLEISIPEYYRIPWFGGLFSIKGNFANGFMGASPINPQVFKQDPIQLEVQTYFHQKSIYGRLGRSNWKIQAYAGLNHQVQWGGEKSVYGDAFKLNSLATLWHVLWGIAYGEGDTDIPKSKIGNHLGSIDLALGYDFGRINMLVYRQNFYEVGAISKLANIKDGLNGIALTNKNYSREQRNFNWERVLVEFFYSKDQAGYPWSKPTKSGDEDYYNNYYYEDGWSYKQQGLGTPLIIPAHSAAKGQAHSPGDFFISNRVIAAHFGIKGHVRRWQVRSKISYARHYGTFATSEYGKTTGLISHPPHEERFSPKAQLSSYLRVERRFFTRTGLGATLALDQGGMLPASFGAIIHFKHYFRGLLR